MAELNIAIADDNRQTLEMLGEILESEKDYHVVGKADNGNEAYIQYDYENKAGCCLT